jgi:putative lipoprotein
MRLVALVLLCLAAACRKAPAPPAPAAAPELETPPPAAGSSWDPWEEAKSRGIEFRAVGNEPGWFLEIDNERWMRLLYAYGERVATLPVPKPVTAGGTTTFASSGAGHTLTVTVTPGPCSDGMSDMTYPLSVAVVIDEVPLRGCGRWLNQK